MESECQILLEMIEVVTPKVESYLDAPYGTRRQMAILHYLDRVETEFKDFGVSSVVETFTKGELNPFSNYNRLDIDGDFRIGAALWNLDRLRAGRRLSDAFEILPDTAGAPDVCCLQTDFHHPCYDNNLIQSVICVLTNRYADERQSRSGSVLKEENAMGKEPDNRYKALLRLLPEKDVRAACESFKAKLWELITRKMKGQAYFDKAMEQQME